MTNNYYRLQWRSPEKVQERHEYIISLTRSEVPLALKEIALLVKERFGSPTGKPMDHSTVTHHIQKHNRGKCFC